MTLTLWKDLSVRREVRKHLMSGDEDAKKAAAVEAKGGGHLKPAALKNFYNHAWQRRERFFGVGLFLQHPLQSIGNLERR